MFTGIVEETGQLTSITAGESSIRLCIQAQLCATGIKIGDSLAVNGCCLTVASFNNAGELSFDLLRETWNRTSFHTARPGALVNLERSLPADGRLHGHFVTGHIDATTPIDLFEKRGADWFLRISVPQDLSHYIAFKGSIAVDGISLTVAEVAEESFSVWIIPHTYAVTALRERSTGSLVNLETDLLAKYLDRLRADH
jgi:riboflavin synthase